MTKLRILDLFCGEGGAAMGYRKAGFEVVGVDNVDMPRFPFEFHQADALKFLRAHHKEFDAFHASPPCKAHSIAQRIHKRDHECFIARTRRALRKTDKPYVIENTPLSPLKNFIELSGGTFGLRVIRRRLFESNFYIKEPPRFSYSRGCTNSHRGLSTGGEYICVAGHNFLIEEAREAMEINWMGQQGIAQAVPPAYTRYISRYLKKAIKQRSSQDE